MPRCSRQVRLRRPRITDAPAIAREADDPAVYAGLRDYFPHPYTVDDALRYVDTVLEKTGPATDFVIEVDGEPAGIMGLFPRGDVLRYNAEIGYWLGQRYWRQGIGTSAVRWTVDYAWRVLEMRRVYAEVFAANVASIGMLRACGFAEEYRLAGVVVKAGVTQDLVSLGIRRDASGGSGARRV